MNLSSCAPGVSTLHLTVVWITSSLMGLFLPPQLLVLLFLLKSVNKAVTLSFQLEYLNKMKLTCFIVWVAEWGGSLQLAAVSASFILDWPTSYVSLSCSRAARGTDRQHTHINLHQSWDVPSVHPNLLYPNLSESLLCLTGKWKSNIQF